MPVIATSSSQPISSAHERWSFTALFSIAFLGIAAGTQMSDRGLQSVLLLPIQRSFEVGDATIGALQGLAGVLVGSAIAVPVGRIADRMSRKRVLLSLIAAWTALTALSGLAPSFPLFFIGRAASGVTEFAMIPVVYSLIPDLAPERHRVIANLCFAALMAMGASAGFYFGDRIVALATQVIPYDGEPWRRAMLLLSLFGIPLLLLGLLIADPPRGLGKKEMADESSLGVFLRERWRALGLFAGVAGSLMIAVQGLNLMIALALQRSFSIEAAALGHALGIITLTTTVGCLPVAAAIDRLLCRRFGASARPLIMSGSAALALPCAAGLLFASSADGALTVVALFLFLTCTANALVPTMLQDLTPASMRARSFAVWSFTVSVFCAIGPLLVGVLSDTVLHGNLLAAIATVALPSLALSIACGLFAARPGIAFGRRPRHATG